MPNLVLGAERSATAAGNPPPKIQVRGLTVTYRTEGGEFAAVRDANLDVPRGQVTALIGESGSGKTTLALGMLKAVSSPGRITSGEVLFEGAGDLLKLDGERLRRFRGRETGMVFQASQNSLSPLKRVGAQILDLGRAHGIRNPRTLLKDATELARKMSLPPERMLTAYQHELSGGMRQRVSIIMALLMNPGLLVLDEPTTALDVISQAQVLDIIKDVHHERNLTVVLITHDLGVVAELAHHLVVLYGGMIVEEGPTTQVLRAPRHPYTQALLNAIPRLTGDTAKARPLSGSPPSLPTIPLDGCVFRDRCAFRMSSCEEDTVPLHRVEDRMWRCWLEPTVDAPMEEGRHAY